ncbi:terminase large subunit [Synechococcus phage BUCT-ZZ01]|nr:terminase large subunit [Synechococcus phage BUCT-ZZ01]
MNQNNPDGLPYYMGNPQLKAARVSMGFSIEQAKEHFRCSQDPVYFLENYGKVVSLDLGVVPFKLFPYQKRIIRAIHENPNIIGKLFRQAGKSTVIAGYITWYVIFNRNKTAAILANKAAIAKEIFSRVQFFIENLPFWLQQGIVEWNKTSLVLENESRCFCAASSPSAIRGMSINLLLCDEFAHLSPNLAEEFTASVFPTISSAKTSKLILISTPNGLNHYHKMWKDAVKGTNGFIPVEGIWQEHPLRDQAWADRMRQQLGEVKFRQEIECSFEGSSYTLIEGRFLSTLPTSDPIDTYDKVKIYEKPVNFEKNPAADHMYVITVDTSRGQHMDYSAFVVFDISKMPYRVVATFKDNTIPSTEYAPLIHRMARAYNDAYVLVEINDIGGEVANNLWFDYEYENVYFTQKDKLTEARGYPGVRTTKKVKAIGCSTLKDLVEKHQLDVVSADIIHELSMFVQKRTSYEAEDKAVNDDLTACMWLFAWLSKQPIFEELTNNDTRKILAERRERSIAETMMPLGFYNNGSQFIEQKGLPLGMTLEQWIVSDDPRPLYDVVSDFDFNK